MNANNSSSKPYAPFQPLPDNIPNFSYIQTGGTSGGNPSQFSYDFSNGTNFSYTPFETSHQQTFGNIYGTSQGSIWHEHSLGTPYAYFPRNNFESVNHRMPQTDFANYNTFSYDPLQQSPRRKRAEVTVEEIPVGDDQFGSQLRPEYSADDTTKQWAKVNSVLDKVQESEYASQSTGGPNQRQQHSYFRQNSSDYNNEYFYSSQSSSSTNGYSYPNQDFYVNQQFEAECYCQQAGISSSYPFPGCGPSIDSNCYSDESRIQATNLHYCFNDEAFCQNEATTSKLNSSYNHQESPFYFSQHATSVQHTVNVNGKQEQSSRQVLQHEEHEFDDGKDINQLNCFKFEDFQVEQSRDSWTQLIAEINEKRRELAEEVAAATEYYFQSAVVIEEVDADESEATSNLLLLTYEPASLDESISLARSVSDICFSSDGSESEEDDPEPSSDHSTEDENTPITNTEEPKGNVKKTFPFRGFRKLRTLMKSSFQKVKKSFGCCFGQPFGEIVLD